ncbi:MAG: MFS transporter [Clostridia bacterium]|nr:MFS transporter [Clostridia bacterium]
MKKDTAAIAEKRRLKEEKQLRKLTAQQNKGTYVGYFAMILFLITFVNIIDEVTSNLPNSLQSSYITEFFVTRGVFGKFYAYEDGLALHQTINVVSYVFGIITPFYKALADRFGRKPLFAMSTFGMSLGLLVTSIAPNYAVFLFGSALISFFMGHDMQIIYILEVAPSDKRARIYSLLKGIGIIGVVFVPMLRSLLMGNDATQWRKVFFVPSLVGMFACLLVILFSRETKVFLEERIAYLSRPFEDREAERRQRKEKKQADDKNHGVINACKYIFANKDTRYLIISHIVFDTAIASVGLYYESAMHIAGMSTEQITNALFVLPIVYALQTILSGVVADKFGRKSTICFFSCICIVFYILFAVGINNGWSAWLIGAFCGFYQGGYWIGRDYMNIMMTEKVPTEIRASVVGAEGLLVIIGMAVGYLAMVLGILVMPVWASCLVVALPCVLAAVIMLMKTVKETKGTRLENAGKEEVL